MSLQAVPNLRVLKRGANARLVVVSNRLPMTLQKTEEGWRTVRSTGGLASAMNPIREKTGGEWIGWAGDSGNEQSDEKRAILAEWAEADHCFAVDLPTDVATGFYAGVNAGSDARRNRAQGVSWRKGHRGKAGLCE